MRFVATMVLTQLAILACAAAIVVLPLVFATLHHLVLGYIR